MSKTRIWRKVVKSDMQTGAGRSIFPPYLPLGNMWELTLECGHIVHRQPRYKPLADTRRRTSSQRAGWFYRREAEDALPPPKRVLCERCKALVKPAK